MILHSDPLLMLIHSAEWIAIASLKTIPLIAFVVILQRFFRKQLSAASRHLLWLSVLLSLSIPIGWALDIDGLSSHKTGDVIFNSEPDSTIPGSSLLSTTNQQSTTTNNIVAHDSSITKVNLSFGEQAWAAIIEYYPLGLAIVWACGALVFFVLTLVKARYFHRIKINASCAAPDIVSLFMVCQQELRIHQTIQLLSTSEIQSPITLGWVHPAVIVPENIAQKLAPDMLKHVLLHELGHIKRQDIFFNWLACLINILHWFNPVVWLACKRMRMDMEIACDALVLNHLDKSQRKKYGATLIEISQIPRVSPKALTTLGILENHTELKERLNMIKDFTTMNIKNSIFFGVILTATAITSLAQPNTTASEKPSTASVGSTSDKRTDDYIDLKDFAKIAEKELKTKVLVGQNEAQKIIQINLGKEPLNYGQFLTQLKINEYTAYKSKDYIQIVPMREARNLSIPIVEKGKTYFEDEVVTDYLRTEKACSGQVLATIRPLIPQYAHLSVYEDSRTMVIIDTYGNIQRIKSVITALEANLDAPVDCKSIRQAENRPAKNEAK